MENARPDFPVVGDAADFEGEFPDNTPEPNLEDEQFGTPAKSGQQRIGEVESDVPVPRVTRRKYPFESMGFGDSFEVETDPAVRKEVGPQTALNRLRSSLSSSATSWCKTHPDSRMVIRKVGKHTLRCWRMPIQE